MKKLISLLVILVTLAFLSIGCVEVVPTSPPGTGTSPGYVLEEISSTLLFIHLTGKFEAWNYDTIRSMQVKVLTLALTEIDTNYKILEVFYTSDGDGVLDSPVIVFVERVGGIDEK